VQFAEDNLFVRDWQFAEFNDNVDIAEQLALEADMLTQVANGQSPDRLYLWSSNAAIVVGKTETQLPNYAHACAQLNDLGWSVLPRLTGGTAFAQGPGILNLSAVCTLGDGQRSIKRSYQDFCDALIHAFASIGVNVNIGGQSRAFCDGDYNLLLDQKKLVGTAQRWRKSAVLAHAAILMQLDKDYASNAVNLFYELVGSDKRFDQDAIVDLQSYTQNCQVEFIKMALENAFSSS